MLGLSRFSAFQITFNSYCFVWKKSLENKQWCFSFVSVSVFDFVFAMEGFFRVSCVAPCLVSLVSILWEGGAEGRVLLCLDFRNLHHLATHIDPLRIH